MNIIEQNKEKINGILETFDRMIINGYLLNLCNYRHFLYYLIQNNIQLKDFDEFKEINSNIYFRSNNFFGQVEVFTKATMPEESKTILGYMKKNKIYNYRYVSKHQIRKMYSGMLITINDIYGVPTNIYSPEEVFEKIKDTNEEQIVGRKTFAKEDVEIVLEYMKLNNLSSLIEVFKLVQDKYLKGEINIEDELRKNKAKILKNITYK